MTCVRKRVAASVAVLTAAVLFVTLGVSLSSADEPKKPVPPPAPRLDPPNFPRFFRDGGALNSWSLDGAWSVEDESALLQAGGGSITYRFQARDVNLVLAPGPEPVRFEVRLDGQPPGDDHGLDAADSGEGTVTEPRMYQLVRQQGTSARTFEITFLDPGVRAYVFTFG